MEVTMIRVLRRSLLVAVAGLMFPAGLALSQDSASPPKPGAHGLPCASRTDVVKILKESFGERLVAHGLATSGAVAELFSSPNGTWTIVATSPNGMSCMVGAGDAWKTTQVAEDSI
jgi:hypothetical protein